MILWNSMRNGGYILTIHLLDKLDLIAYNRKLNYHLAEAEKDYMLTLVLKIIYDSELKNMLIFKGGTAIHHCYLPQLRFSENIDFTSINKEIKLQDIRNILLAYNFFDIEKEYTSNATLKIEHLKYTGPLKQPNSLKIEIDRTQNVYCKPKQLSYSNVWNIDFKVNVMDEREICAEKIRAMAERSRYRDFYDLYFLFNNYNIKQEEVFETISKKEIREPIKKCNIIRNFKRAKQELNISKTGIFYKKEVKIAEINELIMKLNFSVISKDNIKC